MSLTFGSLFAGIGGFDLGFERAGMVCKWQVEIDPFCQKVLAKHWPNVQRYADVREVGKHNLEPVDVICGGFPCQDVSKANAAGNGIEGELSGLWWQFYRLICELRPRFAVVENVSNLSKRGLSGILGGLAQIGYDAEWETLSACAFGAPHTRERMFIVAYPNSERQKSNRANRGKNDASVFSGSLHQINLHSPALSSERQRKQNWKVEPQVDRMANGLPRQLDRVGALGNAIVPEEAELIASLILRLSNNSL